MLSRVFLVKKGSAFSLAIKGFWAWQKMGQKIEIPLPKDLKQKTKKNPMSGLGKINVRFGLSDEGKLDII